MQYWRIEVEAHAHARHTLGIDPGLGSCSEAAGNAAAPLKYEA